MANILVITHGNLANEFVNIAETITEQKNRAIPVCFGFQEDLAEYSHKLTSVMESLDPNEPTIILTDLFGGTPSNVAIPFIQRDKVEVITGLSLPMLIFLLTQPKNMDFEEMCKGARQAARDAILIAGEFLE
jgi:PTS system mannose-specific IIA component